MLILIKCDIGSSSDNIPKGFYSKGFQTLIVLSYDPDMNIPFLKGHKQFIYSLWAFFIILELK